MRTNNGTNWMGALARIAMAFAVGASLASVASAQVASCPDSVAVEGWEAGDLSSATAGSSRPVAPDGLELCGASEGFGATADSYRFLTRRQSGNFVFEAELVDIAPGGSAGVVARRSERNAAAAHVRIAIHRQGDTFVLDSGVRSIDGAVATMPAAAVSGLALPLRLRIERRGDVFATAYTDETGAFVPHLTADLPALEGSPLVVGLMQSSGDTGAVSTATFAEAEFAESGIRRADLTGCVEAATVPEGGGAEVTLRGAHLDAIEAIQVAGSPATIVDASSERLIFRMPASPGGIVHAPVVIEEEHGSTTLPMRVAWAGRPFVRGDLNDNGRVTRGDLKRLERYLEGRVAALACPEAADVDGNGAIDRDDVNRLAGVLAGTAEDPPAPYPVAGLASGGGLACGLPRAPRIRLVRFASRERFSADTEIREGDVLEIRGSGFPRDPERTTVLFGNVLARVLEGSNARRLIVEIGPVADAGSKCPQILVDSAMVPEPESADGSVPDRTRFGLAYAVEPGSGRDHLCPDFAASDYGWTTVASLDPGTATLFLPVGEAQVDRSLPFDVVVNLGLPLVTGVSRGPRVVRLRYFAPPVEDAAGSSPSYEDWLGGLAEQLTTELNGGPADGCSCDVRAESDPERGGISFVPCDPVLGWIDPDPTPDPPAPGFNPPLRAPKPPLWGATGFTAPAPPIPPCNEFPRTSRDRMWCHFARVTQPTYKGLPRWEYFLPLAAVLKPHLVPWLPAPAGRTPAEKEVMYSADAATFAHNAGYTNPCAIAARRVYCKDVPGISGAWMPRFPDGQYVIKTFWLAASKLPMNADPDDFYSYQPPAGERQYLAGMHIASSNQDAGAGTILPQYWNWATYWVPKPIGDTHSKDGTPLVYNETCTEGSFANQPATVLGVWRNYVMCSSYGYSDGGDAYPNKCGNPWGPSDECHGSCLGCHAGAGLVDMNDLGENAGFYDDSYLRIAWLPTLTDTVGVLQCRDQIVASIEEGILAHKKLAPPECK